MRAFRIVDCPECGEDFNIAVTNVCPECKSIYTKPIEYDDEEIKKKKKSRWIHKPVNQDFSPEERLTQIHYLLINIDKNVSYFAWILSISLITGFFWYIDSH